MAAAVAPGDLAREIVEDRGLQKELPRGDDLDLEAVGDALDVFLSGFAHLGTALLYVLAGVLLLLLALWLAERLRRRDGPHAPAVPRGEGARERLPTEADAERAAASGQFALAVHLLLLCAIRHIARRTPVPPARTSRELLRSLPLQPDARAAFAELVRAVELAVFGGAQVGAGEYAQCVARYRTVVAP